MLILIYLFNGNNQKTPKVKRIFYTFAHLKRRLNDEKNKQKMQKFG